MSTFVRKRILSALRKIAAQWTTTRIDPVTKTVYGKIKIGVANNTYDELLVGGGVNLQLIPMKSIIPNNILFFTKTNIIMHFPRGFAHIFSAVRT